MNSAKILRRIMLFAVVLAASCATPERMYERAAAADAALAENPGGMVDEADIATLPVPVQTYLRNTGWIGKPRPWSFSIRFSGSFRTDVDKGFFDITARQVSTLRPAARHFYMEGPLFSGRHWYTGGNASFRVKLLSLVTVVDESGAKMDTSEQLTFLNDACLMVPGALPYLDIAWETLSDTAVRAVFTDFGRTVSAELRFGPDGLLRNFITHERYMGSDMDGTDLCAWETPVRDYREQNGILVPAYGEALWRTASGVFSYAKFNIDTVMYNQTAP